ncbi:mannan endo-1,4-beta-mannosidase [Pedobacter sp. UYP30]|uniref:cellulase family glycosylhydrolase n=1 Tax=Pedobacter sp. UYP30 TaxID=1756400 RepID=UPI003396BB4B
MKNSRIICLLFAISITIFGCKKKEIQDGDLSFGLHVKDGKYLADKCDNKIILRGVNMGNIYAVNFGLKELEEIEKTGANAVRIVLEKQYKDYSKGGVVTALTAEKIEPLIKSCIEKGMIPVLELHDYTGSADISADLPKATQWWITGEIKTLLLRYNKSIIINVANEPDNGNASAATYRDVNIRAIKTLRDAGYNCPIMLDASGYGKDHTIFISQGKAILEADPLHDLLFSVHAYWPTVGLYGNYSDAQITDNFKALKQSGLPVVFGELAVADIQNAVSYKINYKLLMSLCQENEFGYLAWWWGFNNNPGANNLLSMTNDGLFNGLQDGGKTIAVDDPNSIKNTSKRVCK